MASWDEMNVDILVNKTIDSVKLIKDEDEDITEISFVTNDGVIYKLYHEQDCCEWVRVEEIVGDIEDLLDTPILMAEEVTQEDEEDDYGTKTWTFYKFGTIKGYVTIRWLGESNGYYSEAVSFDRVN